jgi:dihydroflavonol-4-reductase
VDTVVVTGASGHIGGNLVRELLDQGRAVRVLVHRDRRAIEGLDVECVEGDVCDATSIAKAFEGAGTVYHAAAHISLLGSEWRRLESVNVCGTRNVVEASLQCGVRRLVHFSSIHAMEQRPLDVPIDETRPLVNSEGSAAYDRSKAAAEREVRDGISRGLDAVILNPTAVVGPYDFRPSHLGQTLLALGRGQLPALVRGGFDWVDVRDVVEAALCAEKQAPLGAKYLLSGRWASVVELATLAEQITGVPAPRFACPLGLALVGAPFSTAWYSLRGERPLFTKFSLRTLRSNRRISHARATRDLNYHPRPLHDTLEDAYAWFVQTGRLGLRRRMGPRENG